MNINITKEEKTLTIELEGRLDTITAPHLEAALKQNLGDAETLTLDFAGIEYISSAGLRVLLSAQKVMNKQGKMVIKHVNEAVMEVFEIMGFVNFLTLEP